MDQALVVLLAVILREQSALACNFGPSCPFSCNCVDDEECDPVTGQCPLGGCRVESPATYGWTGLGCQTGNVVYGKEASQNGQHGQYSADKAIDGLPAARNTTERRDSDVCAQTHAISSVPFTCLTNYDCVHGWWQVDLGSLYYIRGGIIYTSYNETEKMRLNHIDMRVGNFSDVKNYHYELCDWIAYPASVTNFKCHTPRVGRYLTLYKYNQTSRYGDDVGRFTLCEIVVNGNLFNDCTDCQGTCTAQYGCVSCPPGLNASTLCNQECDGASYGDACSQTCAHCSERAGERCDKQNGRCLHGCDIWWHNEMCTQEIALVNLKENDLYLVENGLHNVTLSWAAVREIPANISSFYGYYTEIKSYTARHWTTEASVNHVNGKVYREIFSNLHRDTLYDFRVVPFRTDGGYTDRGQAAKLISLKTLCGEFCETVTPHDTAVSPSRCPGIVPPRDTKGTVRKATDSNWSIYFAMTLFAFLISVIVNIVLCVMLRRRRPSLFTHDVHFTREHSHQPERRPQPANRELDNHVPMMHNHDRAVDNDYIVTHDSPGRQVPSERADDDNLSLDMLGEAPAPPSRDPDRTEASSDQYEPIF